MFQHNEYNQRLQAILLGNPYKWYLLKIVSEIYALYKSWVKMFCMYTSNEIQYTKNFRIKQCHTITRLPKNQVMHSHKIYEINN